MRKKAMILLALVTAIFLGQGLVSVQNAQAQNLVGLWRSQMATPLGAAYGELVLMPNGTFSKTVRFGDLFTRDVGVYTVGQGFIHFTITDHEPKYYRGVRQHWITSETWFFQFQDENRITFEDRIAGTRWVATRAR